MKYHRTKKELTDLIPWVGLISSMDKTHTTMKYRASNNEITSQQKWLKDTFDTTYNLGILGWNILLATGITNEIYNILY